MVWLLVVLKGSVLPRNKMTNSMEYGCDLLPFIFEISYLLTDL